MNDQKTYPITAQGKAKLEAELEDLKVNKRKEIIERIKVARSFGDLSENSEYESARDEQAMLEGRIATMENQIRFAEIIDDKDVAKDEVTLGRKVTFVELPDGDEESYTIVGSAESDPMDFKISNDSPIAQAILGKKIGDKVSIDSPGGAYEVEIVAVENAN